ncbi:putative protein serine/threonine kinase [Tieghemostelium lacteum]|uniref:Protein kinase domain-containing protein n=1 Tax=Tieghemostelium lacteum TaxID=361077 RepID=A0A151ZBS5_TIELA|nr:putative protein serine/threonine kinase [Tieghemostelium lacteum]|eukprot:KYQ91396.1 putative protein serine/threonine kinase [Tieghemostelium lacteum]
MEDYIIIERVGEGTYGYVYRAVNRHTGRTVALKQIMNVPKEDDGTSIEVKYLTRLRNQSNIVNLIDHFYTDNGKHLFLVMEFVGRDLWKIISNPQTVIDLKTIKNITRQLLEAVYQCHSRNVMHRDIKPANLLLSPDGVIKLTDFGLSTDCRLEANQCLSSNVVSLYYRPPELLMGSTKYGPEIDMWSIGCILMEMVTNSYLFAGEIELQQLQLIFKRFGTPKESNWPGISNSKLYPDNNLIQKFPEYPQKSLLDSFPYLQFLPHVLDLASKLLTLDPRARINSYNALNHSWFNQNDSVLDHLIPSSSTFVDDLLQTFSTNLSNSLVSNNNHNNISKNNVLFQSPQQQSNIQIFSQPILQQIPIILPPPIPQPILQPVIPITTQPPATIYFTPKPIEIISNNNNNKSKIFNTLPQLQQQTQYQPIPQQNIEYIFYQPTQYIQQPQNVYILNNNNNNTSNNDSSHLLSSSLSPTNSFIYYSHPQQSISQAHLNTQNNIIHNNSSNIINHVQPFVDSNRIYYSTYSGDLSDSEEYEQQQQPTQTNIHQGFLVQPNIGLCHQNNIYSQNQQTNSMNLISTQQPNSHVTTFIPQPQPIIYFHSSSSTTTSPQQHQLIPLHFISPTNVDHQMNSSKCNYSSLQSHFTQNPIYI